MLFVAQFKSRNRVPVAETTAHRIDWQPPAGIKVLAEYWCVNSNLGTVVVFESDDVDAIQSVSTDWADDFEIEVSPAWTAQHGMEMARQKMG